MRRFGSTLRLGGALMVLLALAAFAAPLSTLDQARELYNRTEYEAALNLLNGLPQKDAAAYLLIGRAYYMQGEPKKATEPLERAVNMTPASSEAWLWLGRAYGRRAETSSFLTAPRWAVKTRQAFEKSVELDPRNQEAVSDLFQYYLDAPGFLGGGLDKAEALIRSLATENPAEFHWAQARLAQKRKEFQKAEQQLRRAAELAPRQIGRVLDLATFLAKNGRYQESEDVFRRAEKIDPNSPRLMFERASAYIHAGRNLELARQLLKRYLEAPLTPDDPPRREARELLKSAS